MEGTKIKELKKAVSNFLDQFLANGVNEVKIIEYDYEIMKDTPFANKDNRDELDISRDKTGSGTNIDYGLTRANQYITTENAATTSVILMSDGSPYAYYNDKKGKPQDGDLDKNTEEALESAGWIKEKHANIYTVGFHISDNSHASKLMEAIASSEDKYYQTDNGDGLSEAFDDISETITSTHDGTPISLTTENGIATITTGFEEGQRVEIYTGTYVPNSTPTYTYSWDTFAYQIASYENNTITFDLRAYMEANNITDNVTIRFVDNVIASSRALTQFINIVEEESEEEVNKLIQEIDEKEESSVEKENNEKVQTDTTNKVEYDNEKLEDVNKDVTNNNDTQSSTDTTTEPTNPEETKPEETKPIEDDKTQETEEDKVVESVKDQESQNSGTIETQNIDNTSNVKE